MPLWSRWFQSILASRSCLLEFRPELWGSALRGAVGEVEDWAFEACQLVSEFVLRLRYIVVDLHVVPRGCRAMTPDVLSLRTE
jgi:hypothetical protein